jgi:copper resistance protein D
MVWLFVLLVAPMAAYAEGENHDPSHDHKAEMAQDDGKNHSTHHHENGGTEDSATTPSSQDRQPVNLIAPSGHHHRHRPPLLPPDQDQAYSELNHHVAGVFVLLAGGIALLASADSVRFSWARFGWPGFFFLLGVFLLVRHDPESWPVGPLSLQESLSDAQVVQHVIFACIVLAIGIVEWLRCRGILTHSAWSLVFPALAVSAAFMLFAHKHGEGPSADKIYRHHIIMAIAGVIAMIAKVIDDTQLVKGKISSYLWTGLMMFIGLMLLIYTE